MRHILPVLFLAFAALAQSALPRISPDEAQKNLIKKYDATYPQLAHAGRIQGNVIIEIGIDESGAVFSRRLVSGHPLLAPAAMDAVSQWKFQPFMLAGKPARVVTLVIVRFGDPSNHQAEDRAEMLFQHDFWVVEDSAQEALAAGDFARAEGQLNRASSLLPQAGGLRRHTYESWKWMTAMGQVRTGQRKYDDAEQYYKKALTLREQDDKNSPEMAETLGGMSALYVDEKQYDRARDYSGRATAIYRKNFKGLGSKNPGAQQVYGRAIASQAWMLAKVALQEKNQAEASAQCQVVLEFRDFLAGSERESVASACQDTVSHDGSRN